MRPFPALACALSLLVALLPLPVATPDAHASTPDYYFSRLGREHGLRQNSVTAIVQDAQGFVWVGTQGGLHRYDGHRYASFRHDPRDPATLPDNYVTALAVGGDGAVWVGMNAQYVARLDRASGAIRRYAAGPDAGPADRQVRALLPQGDGVWVGTRAGLRHLDPRSGRSRTVLALGDRPDGTVAMQSLVPARGGGAWFGTALGLYRVAADGAARRVGPAEPVRSLHVDPAGTVWIGRLDGVDRLLPGADMPVRAWPARDATDDDGGDVRSIVQAPDGALWFAVFGRGLRRFEPRTGATQALRHDPDASTPLPEDTVQTLFVDDGGMLWTGGLFRGVALADTRGTRFQHVLESRPRAAGHGGDSVRAIAQDDDGSLWIGTDTARLLHYAPDADRLEDRSALLPAAPPNAAGPRARVEAIADAGERAFWLATSQGLVRFDTAARRMHEVPLPGLAGAALRTVLVEPDGSLWLGTFAHGLVHFRPADGTLARYPQRTGDAGAIPHASVLALMRDRRGRVWIGTSDGLARLDADSGALTAFRHVPGDATSLPGNIVRALHEAADGSIWVGTHAGLSRVVERPRADGDGGTLTFEHPLAARLGDAEVPVVYTIAERPAGRFWLGTDSGIMRFDARTGRTRAFGVADGLQDLEFNGGAVAALADGRLAFGGVNGLNLFDPARLRDAPYAPPVRLLSARIDADAPDDDGVYWRPERIEVPASAELLRLRVGALDYSPAARPRYRYRLEGFDRGWIDNGTQQDITYTRLPPGNYVFRAQAGSPDRGWSPRELSIPVHVAAPLWRHPLVLAAAAAAALALFAALAWWWRQRRRRERGYFEQIREREERLQLALWASGEQFWDFDLERRALHRMRVDEEPGTTPGFGVHTQVEADHEIHPEDLPRVLDELRRHLRGQAALFLSEHRIRVAPGHWAWVRARGRVVERDADGRPLRVSGTARDITASRSAERERRVASEVLRSMAEAVAVFDRDFTFVAVNPAFARMTGYSETEVIGRPTRVLDSPQHDAELYRQMRAELERTGRWSGELWQQRKDGSEFLCWLQASAVEEGGGRAGEPRDLYVAVLSDITDQKRTEQELRYLANYDTLTSLPNRTLLSERLSRAIVRARRHETKIALLFLDLDRFKDINDSLGHATGDRILRAAASRLQQTVGPQHTVARLGGDEFTVVLERIASAEEAEQVARDIIRAFGAPLDIDDRHDIAISPSIGIALYPDHALVPTDLLKHADTAMYEAKAIGRRTFMRYHEGMDIEIRRRATISGALRKVLDRGELRLVFQPRLSLLDRRITGVEALLRWESPEHGDIPPAQFIPLAEESGLILEIGEWVLHEACRTLQRWRALGLGDLTMAVNVSALQLLRGDLPCVVARVLDETGVPPHCLDLELTETVLMGNAQATSDTLQAFRGLGVGLAIDDFGTGYSSLAYLKRLPITALKIDKEFIGDITHDAEDEAITSTVITMAHSLGLTVIAEGVETPAQMQFLRDHGCDEVQGFWLARPLEADACVAFIQGWVSQPDDATVAP